jgi:nitrogen fixation NifU-like protein|tara:strand:+ start:690 stop:1088 length:399 start_codon:yes stop_codon:yes gene_type:complete
MDLEILNIASDTDNNKNIKNHTHHSKLKNSLCGDEIEIKLVIKDDKIIDFGYQGKSCIYCQASASLLSKISINNKKNKLNELCDDVKLYFDGNLKIIEDKWMSLKKLFKKENLSRKECILLPFKTLKRIVKI